MLLLRVGVGITSSGACDAASESGFSEGTIDKAALMKTNEKTIGKTNQLPVSSVSKTTEGSVSAETTLAGIRQLLARLNGEVHAFEETYSEVLRALHRVESEALRDDLTGLLRRKPFFSRWEKLLAECELRGLDCGVLMIDIDHFKRINDQYGHAEGDEVIRRVAALLQAFEAQGCLVARLGGEEFALVVPQSRSELFLNLAEIAEQVRGRVETWGVQSVVKRCTVSVGVASARRSGYRAEELLKAADEALYRAKHEGRNRVHAA